MPEGREKTSEKLIRGELYSRAALAKFFGVPSEGSINTGVFQPDRTRYSSIWLFVTEEKEAEMTPFLDKLDGDVLQWQGQLTHRTDDLIINHKSLDLEIVLFYRKTKRQHQNAAFVCEGAFEYSSHARTSETSDNSKPTSFILQRCQPDAQSIFLSLPQTGLIDRLLEATGQVYPCYLFLSLIADIQEKGASSIDYPSITRIDSRIRANAIVAKNHGVSFDNDPLLTSALTELRQRGLDFARPKDKLLASVTDLCRRSNRATQLKACLADTLQNSDEYSNLPSADLWKVARSGFEEGALPFKLLESQVLFQVHPDWISYLEDHAASLTKMLAGRAARLCKLPDSIFSTIQTLFYFDRKHLLAALESTGRSKDDGLLETEESDEEEEEEEEDHEETAEEKSIISESTKSEASESQAASGASSVDINLDATEIYPTNKVSAFEPESGTDSTFDLNNSPLANSSSPLLPPLASLDIKLKTAGPQTLVSAFSRLKVPHYCLFLSLLQSISKLKQKLVPASIITELTCSKLATIRSRGFELERSDLLRRLPLLGTSDDSMERAVPAVAHRLNSDIVSEVLVLAMELEDEFVTALKPTIDDDNSRTVLEISQSALIVNDQEWFNYFCFQNETLQAWIAAQITLTLIKDCNRDYRETVNKLYANEPQLKQSVLTLIHTVENPALAEQQTQEEKQKQRATLDSEAEIEAEDERVAEATNKLPLRLEAEGSAPDSAKDGILKIGRQNLGEAITLPADSSVDVLKLSKIFEHTTASYKFLFFIALLRLTDDSTQDQGDIDFQTIIVEMLVFAAGIIRLNAQISFGTGDRLLDTLARLDIKVQKFAVSWDNVHEAHLRQKAETFNDATTLDLLRYALYLLIRPFVNDRIPKHLSSDAINQKITELSTQFFSERKILYRINKSGRSLTLNNKWKSYINENRQTLIEWACTEFSHYLFKRNPQTNNITFYIGAFSNEKDHSTNIPESATSTDALDNDVTKESERCELSATLDTDHNEEKSITSTINDKPPVVVEASLRSETDFRDETIQDVDDILISRLEASYEQASYLKRDETIGYKPPAKSGALLADIQTTNQFERIEMAFRRVADKLGDLPARRSLCDLELSEDDYLWLAEWCSSLELATARAFLVDESYKTIYKKFSRKCAIGTLLLLLCSEVNRRDGQEGSIWPLFLNIIREELDSVMRSKRFEGQVDYLVRTAFTSAFNQLSLRNVLDSDDHAQYLLSTFLQFGFTRYGIRQVPVWLTNNQSWTEAIRQLLSDHSPNFSQSFADLWLEMQKFHGRRITETQFRSTLKSSKWILPEWHNDLIRVIHNPELKYSLPAPKVIAAGYSAMKTAISPKFCWDPPNEPYFELEFSFDLMNLSKEQTYNLLCNDRSYSLRRGPEGWRLSSTLKLAIDVKEVAVTIVDKDCGTVFSDTAKLWHDDRDVHAFDLQSGRLLEEEAPLRRSRAYAILASADLTPTPLPDCRKSFNEIERKLYLLPADWSDTFHVLLENDVIWRAIGDNNGTHVPTAVHRIKPTLERRRLAPGEPVRISIQGECESAKVEAIRVNGISVEICFSDGRTCTREPVPLGSNAGTGKVQVVTKIKCSGKTFITRHKLDVKVAGCAYFNGVSWTSLAEDTILTVDECRSKKFQLSEPTGKNITRSDFGIFEGNTYRQRLSGSQPLPQIIGTGAAIEIRKLCNRGLDSPSVVIAGGAVNSGLVANLSDISAVELRIELVKPLSFSKNHSFMIWPDDSAPIWLNTEHFRPHSDRSWDFVPCTASTNLAVALDYEGIYQGAAWPVDERAFLRRIAERMEPKAAAALIRWIKWPVLSHESLPAIRQFAAQYPGAALAAWLKAEGLSNGLKFGNDHALDNWDDVTREIFEPWSPTAKSLEDITNHLADDDEDALLETRIAQAALVITRSSPILLAKYLRAYFQHSVLADLELNKKSLIHNLATSFMGIKDGFNERAVTSYAQTIVKACSKQMDVDKHWLENQCKVMNNVLNRIDHNEEDLNNLYSIMSFSSGRQFLSNCIISYFVRTIR